VVVVMVVVLHGSMRWRVPMSVLVVRVTTRGDRARIDARERDDCRRDERDREQHSTCPPGSHGA
jgi:hypothetical protein